MVSTFMIVSTCLINRFGVQNGFELRIIKNVMISVPEVVLNLNGFE